MASDVPVVSRARFVLVAQIMRTLSVGVLAGAVAGVIVGGLGSRIAMRVSGALSENCAELATTRGFECGVVTFGGTMPLVIQGAIGGGVVGGLLYVIGKPWLQAAGRWQGLVFGLLLLVALGSVEVLRPSENFQRFATPWVNVLLYAALVPLFGVAIHWLAGRMDRTLVAVPPQGPLRWHRWIGYGLMGISSALAVVVTGALTALVIAGAVGVAAVPARELLAIGVFPYLVVFGTLVRTAAFRRLLPNRQAAVTAQVVILGSAILGGGALTGMSIGEIVTYG